MARNRDYSALYFIAPTDTEASTPINLDDGSTYTLLMGRSGHYGLPTKLISEKIPMNPGEVLRNLDTPVREVSIPLMIQGSSYSDVATKIHYLLTTFDAYKGTGRLRFVGKNSQTNSLVYRDLWVRHMGDPAIVDGDESHFVTTARGIFTFIAHDPYFYSQYPTVEAINSDNTGFFPMVRNDPVSFLHLAGGSFAAGVLTTNTDDVETWPIWQIGGPASAISFENTTTDKIIEFQEAFTVAAGEELIIDTRPEYKTVELDGTNVFYQLKSTSSLFPITTGSNTINVSMDNTDGDTTLQLIYWNRYLSLYFD